jgi:hypothetical protein
MTSKKTKSELVAELAQLIGLKETPKMSTGSTEPRAIFDAVSDALGLRLNLQQLSKPEVAAEIVKSAGIPWLPNYESEGGTVTREGILEVVRAVQFFLGNTPTR